MTQNWRSFLKARNRGAMSAHDRETFDTLHTMTKAQLAEVAMHLGSICSDEYGNVELALARVLEERDCLKQAGII